VIFFLHNACSSQATTTTKWNGKLKLECINVAEKEGNVEKKEKKIELAIVLDKRKKWKED
jgi:hypothetical protein